MSVVSSHYLPQHTSGSCLYSWMVGEGDHPRWPTRWKRRVLVAWSDSSRSRRCCCSERGSENVDTTEVPIGRAERVSLSLAMAGKGAPFDYELRTRCRRELGGASEGCLR